jgi:hypothetical protein
MEIYRSGNFDDHGCIKAFTSTAPFMPVRVGDLLNATEWGENASGSKLLRVINVEHCISEKTLIGIDPSGSIVHRILIYTQRTSDAAQRRHQPHRAV